MCTRVRTTWVVAFSMLFTGCMHFYHPAEYVIDEDRILGFTTGSPVRILGEQSPAADDVIMTVAIHTWVTGYDEVTALLVAQLTKEMVKRGQPVSDSASKTIRLTVLSLEAEQAVGFFIEGSMQLRLQLGAGRPKELSIVNKSPWNLDRALNGTIARAVMAILEDPDVLAFLADRPTPVPR